MRVLTSTAALAAITIALAMTAPLATAATRTPVPDAASTTTFDLGVDVSDVAPTRADVHAYLAGLEPETQAAILGACGTFVANPTDAKSADTLAFCQVAVGAAPAGATNVKTFASTSPIVAGAAQPAAVATPANPPTASTNGQSANRYRVFPNDSSKGSF
jgi:hypothetical protein